MKKLTKRVQAGGLWFDVPANINYVAFSHTGDVYCYLREPTKPVSDWKKSMFQPCGMVALEGADWRDCCWFVGDQVDGEDTDRREWMARGVEAMGEMAGEFLNKSLDATRKEALAYAYCADKVAKLAAKIRAGEVNL